MKELKPMLKCNMLLIIIIPERIDIPCDDLMKSLSFNVKLTSLKIHFNTCALSVTSNLQAEAVAKTDYKSQLALRSSDVKVERNLAPTQHFWNRRNNKQVYNINDKSFDIRPTGHAFGFCNCQLKNLEISINISISSISISIAINIYPVSYIG